MTFFFIQRCVRASCDASSYFINRRRNLKAADMAVVRDAMTFM